MPDYKPVLSVRIDQSVIDRLTKLEEETGVPRAEIVERALTVGMDDQEGLVRWLQSSVSGPVVSLMMHPTVLKALISVTGGGRVVDETGQKMRKGVRAKSRRASGKPAVE